jgi:Sugar-transfer associated ATP-grasp
MSDVALPILKLRRYNSTVDLGDSIRKVRALTGKSTTRQGIEILSLLGSRQRLSAADYYEYGLWRPELSREEKTAFVSSSGSNAINSKLSPMVRSSLSGLLGNKFLTGLTLRSAGFPSQKPRALYGLGVKIPEAARLESAAEIAAWLRRDGSLPVFGKPLHQSLCIGAASYLSVEDKGKSVRLGNGKVVSIDALAAEIAANFKGGYLFEPLINQPPEVEAITGRAVGALRVVTLREPDEIRVLYVAQRLPAVGSMTDGAVLNAPFSEALIDGESGRLIRVQDMDQMPPDRLEASHVTGRAFAGVVLPFVKEAQSIACEVHRLLAKPGIMGFDIALSNTGPLINEINANPFHSIYQRSGDRGLLNPDFKPRIKAAIAYSRAIRR